MAGGSSRRPGDDRAASQTMPSGRAIMDIGEAREQVAGGLLGGIEIAGLDHVDHGVDASVNSSSSSCSWKVLARTEARRRRAG